MDVNGESMDKKWLKETLALELIIAAPWLLVVPSANKYKDARKTEQYL